MRTLKFKFSFVVLLSAIVTASVAQADNEELASLPNLQLAQPAAIQTPPVAAVPVRVVYVSENQPVQIVDSQGRLLQVIYLKRNKN